ncbi:MAG: hypothetical protein ACMG6E_01850 [Candidatus Roizmanbacteria bacterium]
MKFFRLLYPLFFTLFPILQFYSSNRKEVVLTSIWMPIAIAFGLTLTWWVIMRFLLKSSTRASFMTVIATLFFYSYGHIRSFLFSYLLKSGTIFRVDRNYVVFLIVCILAYALWKFFISAKDPKTLQLFLAFAGFYLVFINLFQIVPYEIHKLANPTTKGKNLLSVKKQSIENKPDIYYIIPDRYGNSSVLSKYYDFDNSDFINFLKEKGFYVAEDSFANFPKTHLSIASSLNLEYINYLSDKLGRDYSSYTPAFDLVENNKVANTLISLGYKYFYFGDWWEPTRISRIADENINLFVDSNEFTRKFFETTALNAFPNSYLEKLFVAYSPDKQYNNLLYKFDKLGTIAKRQSPKFIFAHMLMPHYPYLFDKNCKRKEDLEGIGEKGQYLAELQCSNALLKKAITGILAHSKKPPIIIIQSDEGPFDFTEMKRSGEDTDWTKVSQKALETHMKIINAYYVPDEIKKSLYPGITPVNSFRVVFNALFKTKMDILDDTSYFIPNIDRPYDFYEITDKLKGK